MSLLSFDMLKKIPPDSIRWEAFLAQKEPIPHMGSHRSHEPPVIHFTPEIGRHGLAFLEAIAGDKDRERFYPPMDHPKFSALSELLSKIEFDLTKSASWKNYWTQPLIVHGVDPTVIQQHQKRLVTGYRQHVLQMLHPQTEATLIGWEKKFQWIPDWDHFFQILAYCEAYGQEKGCDQLHEDCKKVLTDKQNALLALIEEKTQDNTILNELPLIHQHFEELQCLSAYFELGAEGADEVLSPLKQKLAQWDRVKNGFDHAIDALCALALPGVVVQTSVKPLLDTFLKESQIKDTAESSLLACLEYLNLPATVATIHEKIMATRAKACIAHRDDTSLLRQEIRKVTVYRVRRNLIRELYMILLKEQNAELILPKMISPDLEICLMTLQEEYLHAIYRQIEPMDSETMESFLKHFTYDSVLLPLPPTRPRGEKNAFARRELSQMRTNIELAAKESPKEEAPLHDIDCPIEMDVLGEMSRYLMKLTENQLKNMDQMNAILEKLSKTYLWIQEPDFCPLPPYWEAFKSGDYWAAKTSLEGVVNKAEKLEALEAFYDIIHQESVVPVPFFKRLMRADLNRLHNMNEWIKKYYGDTLKAYLDTVTIPSQRDKYMIYVLFLQKRLATPLAKELAEHPQHVQNLVNMLEGFYNRKV